MTETPEGREGGEEPLEFVTIDEVGNEFDWIDPVEKVVNEGGYLTVETVNGMYSVLKKDGYSYVIRKKK